MSDTPSRHDVDPVSDERNRPHSAMWAMWICCIALLLFLFVSLFWR